MSLLSRIQAAQAAGQIVGGRQPNAIEALRKRAKARLEAAVFVKIRRDEELTTVWIEPLDKIARNERLENLGGYS